MPGAGNAHGEAVTAKRKSETRRRTQQVKLRLLPKEAERLRRQAAEQGFCTVQAYILRLLPEITDDLVPRTDQGM